MEPQLFLLPDTGPLADTTLAEESPISWRLDDATRVRGRRGIAEARAALRQATTSTAQGLGETPRRAAA